MKLRVLEEWLQGLDEFEKPKVILEQYATPPHIASCMMHTMQVKLYFLSMHDSLIIYFNDNPFAMPTF